ncbi:hypothetical protein K431DRAFT_306202 [Polychaeton citri CBS 116435]|uniref:Uncharacterized protein n=1 Tax=Polychaeton citri CBS 116435 TaxID=1314669 RepID=A0A9P4Q4P9_9PEZI|nr:hypothetical protein K431DRAFT_306202 [Polychaeton citri CBS 116435]
MPSIGCITISLQSQYNGMRLSEYPATETLLFGAQEAQGTFPPFCPSERRSLPVFDALIETNSASQFWVNYTCQPPPEYSATRYYYFKLFVRDTCLISWCTSAADQWSGKVMHGLFNGRTDFLGRQTVREKRALQFPTKGIHEGYFEIKVYRSNTRRREEPKYQTPSGAFPGVGGVVTSKIGEVKLGQPQRMYSFALLDPIDKPFTTIRYHHRSYEQLIQMGVLDNEDELLKNKFHYGSPSPIKDCPPVDAQLPGYKLVATEDDHIYEDDDEKDDTHKTSANLPPLLERAKSSLVVHKMPIINEGSDC